MLRLNRNDDNKVQNTHQKPICGMTADGSSYSFEWTSAFTMFSCLYSCTMSQSFNNIRLFLTKFLAFNLEAFLRCLFCDKNGLTKYWTKYTSPASMPFVINYVLINASIHTILEFQVDPLIFDEFMFIWSWTRIRSDISNLKMIFDNLLFIQHIHQVSKFHVYPRVSDEVMIV